MSDTIIAALYIFAVVWVLTGLALGVRYLTTEEVPEMSTLQLGGFLLMSALVGFPALVSAAVTIVIAIGMGISQSTSRTEKGDQ